MTGTTINKIFIQDGKDAPEAELEFLEMQQAYSNIGGWEGVAKFIAKRHSNSKVLNKSN